MARLPAFAIGLVLSGLAASTGPAVAQSATMQDETRAIVRDAYIYAFPMIENYNTMVKQLANPASPEYVGGFGRYRHYSTLYTPENHDVVTPNNDTPYSWAWLDLRAEPWVVTVPEVPMIWNPSRGWAALYGLKLERFSSKNQLISAKRAPSSSTS